MLQDMKHLHGGTFKYQISVSASPDHGGADVELFVLLFVEAKAQEGQVPCMLISAVPYAGERHAGEGYRMSAVQLHSW